MSSRKKLTYLAVGVAVLLTAANFYIMCTTDREIVPSSETVYINGNEQLSIPIPLGFVVSGESQYEPDCGLCDLAPELKAYNGLLVGLPGYYIPVVFSR